MKPPIARLLLILCLSGLSTEAAVTYGNNLNTNSNNNYPTDTFSVLKHCLQQSEIVKCLKKQAIISLENVIRSNESWYISDYMALEKDPKWMDDQQQNSQINDTNLDEILRTRIDTLAESRMLQFKPSKELEEEGRKKKGGKGKGGMFMLSGFAIVALLAQMVLGKVAFLAGTAIIIAKLSLLFSLLSGLKKNFGGNSGNDHVVLATEHASSHQPAGWQRSIAQPDFMYSSKPPMDAIELN